MENEYPTILTNMAFWQSPLWREKTESIHRLDAEHAEPDATAPFMVALKLYMRRRNYDVVLTMGIRESMAYGFLCAVTGVRSKQIMTEVFIDHAKPDRWMWRAKTRLYCWIARRAIGMITNSSAEVRTIAARFRMPEDRLAFVPLNATIHPEVAEESALPFILSAGRTLRDYEPILKAARAISAPFTVICDPNDLRHTPVPGNVTIMREIKRSDYLDHLRRCAIVALPLLQAERSTGQVVMLEAMAMGKPVVTTRSPGTEDYIRDGENGYLVAGGDADALTDRCRLLLDSPEQRRLIGDQAREDVRRLYGHDAHARAKLEAIRVLLGRSKDGA